MNNPTTYDTPCRHDGLLTDAARSAQATMMVSLDNLLRAKLMELDALESVVTVGYNSASAEEKKLQMAQLEAEVSDLRFIRARLEARLLRRARQLPTLT